MECRQGQNVTFFVLLVCGTLIISAQGSKMSAQAISALLKRMLVGYDKDIVPVKVGRPIEIQVQLYVNDMVPYEKLNMHYSADFFLYLRWNDYRLVNDSNSNDSIPLSGDSMDYLWMPDLFFPTVKKGTIHTVPEVNAGARLYLNGTVVYSKRMSVVSFCPMEMTYYPFDIQECDFSLMSYTYPNDFIVLTWSDDPIQSGKEDNDYYMSEFNHVYFDTLKANSTFGKLGVHDRLTIRFKFYRYFPFYFLRDFFPCILIVVLSWVSFWIDYTSTPARVSLGITTILTIVTMTNNVRANSPPAGMFRSLDWYLLMCNLFVFAALGEFALVGLTEYKTWRRKKGKQPAENSMPLTQVKPYANDRSDEPLELYPENVERKSKPVKTIESPKTKLRQIKNLHWIDNISKIFFPLGFCVFNAVYFLFHRFSDQTVD